MDAVFLRGALVVLVLSGSGWALLSVVVLGGRTLYDRGLRGVGTVELAHARRLVQRAARRPRTEWGRWRRIAALTALARARHAAAPRLLRRALADPDPAVATAATRSLGALGDEWAVELLLEELRRGRVQRSRIASQLERLAPLPGPLLLPLLHDPDPAVRFWGATLLAPYGELGESSLLALARDPDADVRAAAVETLGARRVQRAGPVILELLEDPAWFVRVHAARSAGQVLGAASAPGLTRLLSDSRWWVRTAAKDALRSIGREAIPDLVSVLVDSDEFARNGAAEVLQDIGLVDHLAVEDPTSPLLQRIFEAGGERLREAAEERAERAQRARVTRAA